MQLELPYSCYINLTSKCNLRCKHCFGSYCKQEQHELDWKVWKKVIGDIEEANVFYVNISGGEPTQSQHFEKFLFLLNSKGIHFILTTNGVFSKETREIIMKNSEYMSGIKISLDGYDRKSHEFIRGNGTFEITMENIKYFSDKKIPMTIATVLHKKNITNIDKMRKLISKINPISWFISPIIPLGRAEVSDIVDYKVMDINFWKDIEDKNKKELINTRFIDTPIIEKGGLSAYECPASINMCEIHSDGLVSPCTLSRICIPKKEIKFENIKDKSLKEIWNGKPFKKFRKLMTQGCSGCKMKSKCGRCVAQSFKYFGNGTSPTPFCMAHKDLLGLKKYQSIFK